MIFEVQVWVEKKFQETSQLGQRKKRGLEKWGRSDFDQETERSCCG
jgi:hypothetical protein